MMRALATTSLVAIAQLLGTTLAPPLSAQVTEPPSVTETAFELEDGSQTLYGISLPAGYDNSIDDPRPLVLALHPGGRSPYYGSWFMQSIVEPALRDWEAVIVAPDVPDRNWSSTTSERAVLALLDDVLARHAIDRSQILITGFSMGGRGTWYLASRNAELFTGAVVMAASPADVPLDDLSRTPLYVIHSPDDERIPYQPVEEAVLQLAESGHLVQLLRVPGASHNMMGDYIGPLRRGAEWVREQWEARTLGDR